MPAYWLEERDKKEERKESMFPTFRFQAMINKYKIKRVVIQDKRGNRY